MGWLADSILRVLRERPGEVVTTAELIAAVYQNDPGGGPDNAEKCIRVIIHHMRRRGTRIDTIIGYRVPHG
jgi:DNA-binding response OmpR family regulator